MGAPAPILTLGDNVTDLFDNTAPVHASDLSNSSVRATMSRQIKRDIDIYCETAYDSGHRKHLGASQIGHVCKRYLWYVFRWVKKPTYINVNGVDHKGRMMRLFNRGHREEERFVEWLRGVGCTVQDKDPNTQEQFRIKGVMGHFGGSLDGKVWLPPRYGYTKTILGEFKTQGTGPKFEALLTNGAQKEKPVHFVQMSTYGFELNLEYAIYNAINKNDDDLHVEIVELDWKLGAQMFEKARGIILSQPSDPPPKFSLSPATMECRTCDFVGICHRGEPVEKNCRSCIAAQPVDNSEWRCNRYNLIIPEQHIAHGCADWSPVK